VRWDEAGGRAAVRAHRQGGAGPQPRRRAAPPQQLAGEVATGRFRAAAASGAWIGTTCAVSYRPGGLASLRARRQCAPPGPRPLHAKADLEAQARFNKGGLPQPLRRPA